MTHKRPLFVPFLTLFALMSLQGCSFVEVNPGAEHIILSNDAASCKKLGETTVSVMHEIGFIDRNLDAISDELQILAQNSAAKMGGNAIWPITTVTKGEQSFEIFRCSDVK